MEHQVQFYWRRKEKGNKREGQVMHLRTVSTYPWALIMKTKPIFRTIWSNCNTSDIQRKLAFLSSESKIFTKEKSSVRKNPPTGKNYRTPVSTSCLSITS